MEHEIKEINGALYRVFQNGSRVKYFPPHPMIKDIPKAPGVYSITQISTGKIYIGSSKDLRKRISDYCRGSRPNKLTANILTSDISIKVLEVTESQDKSMLFERELYWIIKLQTFTPNGFNKKSPVNNLNINNRPDFQVLTKQTPKAIKHPKPIILKQKPGFDDLLKMFKDDKY
jgi:predicted GIY-YIG superfamily endonuclease